MREVAIQSLPSSTNDAERLASRLGVPVYEIALHRFPDGELRVTVGPTAPTNIIYASYDRPNEKLLAVLFAAKALRRGGAKRLVLLAPYHCYVRQDAAFQEGDCETENIIANSALPYRMCLNRPNKWANVCPDIAQDLLSSNDGSKDNERSA